MIDLNLQNVEELIFHDNKVQDLLPDFNYLFYQWRLARLSSTLKALAKRSLIDFLNGLTNEHLELLAIYFGTKVTLDKVDSHIVRNYIFEIDKIDLDKVEGYQNFSVFRDKDRLYICFWR
jgi:hypothetical protein